MKKIDLVRHITELLKEHDCVILPGLGGFVGNYEPARFNESQQTVRPPSKQILFNPNLVHNDGLLYGQISKVSGLGYKEVRDAVDEFIQQIRKTLEGDQKSDLEGIGYFYMGKDRSILFEPDENANFLADSYGLPYLHYRVFDVPVSLKRPAAILEAQPVQQRVRKWIYAASAACIVAAMVLVPLQKGNWNMAGLDMFRSDRQELAAGQQQGNEQENIAPDAVQDFQVSGQVEPEAETFVDASGSDGRSATGTEGANEALLPATTGESGAAPADHYHIVVGSFKDLENARNLSRQLHEKGYEAEILNAPNQYFRVSARQYATKDEARTALQAVRDEYTAAWVLSN